MRRVLLILAAIAAVVAVEIVWLAPATLVGSRVEKASRGALRLADTEGTIWHARGMLVAEHARLPIAWDLDFWPLLRGEVRLRITPYAGTATGPPRADLTVRTDSVTVRNLDLVVPAPMAAGLFQLSPAWIVGGDLAFAAGTFEWAPPKSRGEARIEWQRARLTTPAGGEPVDLGTLVATLTAHGDGVSGPVRNEGGELDLEGELAMHARDGVALTLAIALRGSADPARTSVLDALGARDGDRWRVEWRVPVR